MTDPAARPAPRSAGLLAALRRRFSVDDDLAYILPMAVFCAITALQAMGPNWIAPCYTIKTLLVPFLLIILWPKFDKIRWTHWQWGAVMGVVGVVQWVVMGKAMLKLDLFNRLFILAGYHPSTAAPVVWNPFDEIHSSPLAWSFIVVRLMGPTLLVPFVEELFWRDYLWRRIASPNDFRLVKLGEWDPLAFWLVPVFFMAVHVQLVTAFVWGLMIGLLLLRTRSLGACIVMHGVTNFLLGVYVLITHDWYFW
jgi:uncharacterized protein